MKPVQPGHQTHVLTAPGCIDLPVTFSEGVWYSYWMPNEKERLEIAAGCPIRLCILSMVHPPVILDVEP